MSINIKNPINNFYNKVDYKYFQVDYKTNLINGEVLKQDGSKKDYDIKFRGALQKGKIIDDNIERAKNVISNKKILKNFQDSVYKTAIRGRQDVKKSYEIDEKGPSLENEMKAKEHKIEEQKETVNYKNMATNVQLGLFNKYGGMYLLKKGGPIPKEIKDTVNKVHKNQMMSYYRGNTDNKLAGEMLLKNTKKIPKIDPIYDNTLDEQYTRFEINESNLLEDPYKNPDDDRYIRGIGMIEKRAVMAKDNLNLNKEFSNIKEYDNLDGSKDVGTKSEKMTLNFGNSYNVRN